MNNTWRLIPPLEASGKMQMAIDRFLLEQQRQRKSNYGGVLRFYTWQPAAISLGYHQKDYPAVWHDLTWQGKPLDIVRRPTGGRAVLHQGDLTYTIVTSIPPGKRLAVYQQICQFLIDGWRSLGVNLEYGTASKSYIERQNCFATATGADLITLEGNKVIGSAQLRRGKTVLQHGSMILDTDPALYRQIFGSDLGQNLRSQISPHQDRLTIAVDNNYTAKIVNSLTQTAIATFKIDLVVQPLSTEEWQDIVNTSD